MPARPSSALIGNSLTINPLANFQWVYSGTGAKGTLALGSAVLNLYSVGSPVFRPLLLTPPALGTYVMTWNTPPTNEPAWTFDGSLSTGNVAVWAFSGNSTWDTGTSWNYPSYTAATLSYTTNGLQLTNYTSVILSGTASPAAGASVTIAPPSTSNVVVTGPAGPVSPGAVDRGQRFGNRYVDSERRRLEPHGREHQRGWRADGQRRGAEHADGHFGGRRRQRELGQRLDQRRHGDDQQRLSEPGRRQRRHTQRQRGSDHGGWCPGHQRQRLRERGGQRHVRQRGGSPAPTAATRRSGPAQRPAARCWASPPAW